MRVLVSQPAGAAALASAQATVAIACAGCTAAPVTFDLWPSTQKPAGASAYLLPVFAGTIPALGHLPAEQVYLSMDVVFRDAFGREVRGGPWTVHLVVVAPPLVANEDTGYAASMDGSSVYPYARTSAVYRTSWSPGVFAGRGGLRFARVVVSSPAPVAVALGAALASPSWELAEAWTTVESGGRSETCTTPCPRTQGARYDASGAVTCTSKVEAAVPPPSLNCAGKSWRRDLTGVHEQFGGTLQLDARGLSAGVELGPSGRSGTWTSRGRASRADRLGWRRREGATRPPGRPLSLVAPLES